MRMPVSTLQRLVRAPRAAWRRIGSFNEWLAINFKISPSRVLQIEISALAAFGFTMMQIGEWLVAVTCWTLSGFILLAKSLAWRGMADRPILTTILRCTLAIGSLTLCVLLITITDLRKPTNEPWSNVQKLWQRSHVAAQQKPLTVHSLFAGDFRDDWGFGFVPNTLEAPDGVKLPFEARLLIDPTAGVKFVAFYIPFNARSAEACIGLADNVEVAGGLNLFHMEARGPGTEPILSKDYQFSGRVYVYHENVYSPEQVGEIHKYYADRHLLVELRGEDYVELEALRRSATH